MRVRYFEERADFFRIDTAALGNLGQGATQIRQEHRRLYKRVLHGHILSEHVNPYAPHAAQMLANLQAYFRSRGADAMTAMQQAYAASRGLVAREAALLAFIDVFFLTGAIFVAMIPLLFVMRKPAPRQRAAPVAAVEQDLPFPSPCARKLQADRVARPDRSAITARGRWDISRSRQ